VSSFFDRLLSEKNSGVLPRTWRTLLRRQRFFPFSAFQFQRERALEERILLLAGRLFSRCRDPPFSSAYLEEMSCSVVTVRLYLSKLRYPAFVAFTPAIVSPSRLSRTCPLGGDSLRCSSRATRASAALHLELFSFGLGTWPPLLFPARGAFSTQHTTPFSKPHPADPIREFLSLIPPSPYFSPLPRKRRSFSSSSR